MASYDNIESPRNLQPGYGTGQSPYGAGDPYYNESTGYITPQRPPKTGKSKWVTVGLPVLVVVVIAAVVGIVVGTRHHGDSTSSSSSSSPGSAGSAAKALGVFPTATNGQFMIPIYPATVSLDTPYRLSWFLNPNFLLDQRSIQHSHIQPKL